MAARSRRDGAHMKQASRKSNADRIADWIPRLVVALVVICAITACGGGSGDGNPPPPAPPGSPPPPPPPGPPPPPPPAQALRAVPAGLSLDLAGTGQLYAVGANGA